MHPAFVPLDPSIETTHYWTVASSKGSKSTAVVEVNERGEVAVSYGILAGLLTQLGYVEDVKV